MPARSDRAIAVLADDDLSERLLHRYLVGFPGEPITLVAAPGSSSPPADERIAQTVLTESENEVADWFVESGPVDIVVDLRNPKSGPRRDRWSRLFLFLRDGGVYIVPRRANKGDLRDSERQWLTALAQDTGRARGVRRENLELECMRSVAAVLIRPELLLIQKSGRHLAKLRDAEVDRALSRRDPAVRVETMAALPAMTFRSTATVVSHESSSPIPGLATVVEVPKLSMRHYSGPVAFGGQSLMYTENSVLTDAFRFWAAAELRNPRLWYFSERLAGVRAAAIPHESLVGDYYHADPQYSGHFGHVMTELVSRLWGWDLAKQNFPQLKVLLKRRAGTNAPLERALLRAYGIDDEDIVCLDRPACIDSLISCNMMWHNAEPHIVHPDLRQVWQRISDRLIDIHAPRYPRIFVSRTDQWTRRRCRNIRQVEEFFADRGFTVVYPESHDLGTQAAMFAEATTIAGFAGSAMFNLMYAQQVQTVILLSQEAYTARNEHLYSLVLGCNVHYFWSNPDIPYSYDALSLEAYDSDWEFDFARNGGALSELLASL